eukprot:3712985-Prymnesium_polylepis.1
MSSCRRHGAHVKVCRATSRPVCRSHCTDRLLLARVAGSITISTGIDRLRPARSSWSWARRPYGQCAGDWPLWGRVAGTITRGRGDRTAGALHVH